jgi:hypothetical protein
MLMSGLAKDNQIFMFLARSLLSLPSPRLESIAGEIRRLGDSQSGPYSS